MEDEELVREVIAEQLIDRGYDVIEAEGGRRALALLDAGCPVDLIISDLSMPGMDGVSLIRAAQLRKPRLPAILLTGMPARPPRSLLAENWTDRSVCFASRLPATIWPIELRRCCRPPQ